MHQSNDLLDYESVDKELDNHIWVDEEIDEKANSYFENIKMKKAELKKAAQNTKSITSYLSLTNSLRFNVASISTYKFLAADAAVQLIETNLVNEAVDTIVINEDGDTIIVDNAELDNMLEKDSKQIDKGTK
ncbi:12804_t:CDS:2, partial [Racocetra persica]